MTLKKLVHIYDSDEAESELTDDGVNTRIIPRWQSNRRWQQLFRRLLRDPRHDPIGSCHGCAEALPLPANASQFLFP